MAELAQGAWLGPGRRRLSRAQSCIPREGEPVGSAFRVPETPRKAAGPRDPGAAQPRTPYGERRAWGENGLHCFPEPRRVGGVVCCPRRVSLCRMQLPEALFGPSLPRVLSAERPSWLRAHGWGHGAESFRKPNPTCPQSRTRVECFRPPETPSKAAGPRDPGAAQPRFALWRAEGRGKNNLC